MKQKPIVHYTILCMVIILIVMSILNISQMLLSLNAANVQGDNQGREIKLKGFELVDDALKTKTKSISFTFDGTFDKPFRKISGVTRRSPKSTKAKPVLKKLFLKGTLIKNNALAIIEDEDGKTFICKKGDRVHNRLIVKIGKDMVTIRDSGGTTVIKVKDR